MTSGASRKRLSIVFVVLGLSLAGLWGRLFYLQAVESVWFEGLAAIQQTRRVTIEPVRGRIYDRRGEILAMSVPGESVFASPSETGDFTVGARELEGALGLEEGKVSAVLEGKRGKHFAWIKRLVTEDEEAAVRGLRLKGVYFTPEKRRYYPHGKMLAQVLGFTGVDEDGLSGVEFAFEDRLKGKAGYREARRDACGESIYSPEMAHVPAVDGCHVVLTIDANIQDFLETAVEKSWRRHGPKGITGIVMDPRTGDILALAERPGFDPNRYADYDKESWRVRAVTDSFEPGSMFKPFVFSAALEEGLVRLDETIYCEDGAYKVRGRVLHDHHRYGNLSALEVVSKSSNIGMAKVGGRLGAAATYGYLKAFGFGDATGLGLPSEARGRVTDLKKWSYYTMTSVPMGHEVSLTAVQMAAAFSAFANGGYLVKPKLVRGILGPGGEIIEKHFEGEVRRRVLSEETARVMLEEVLRAVVTEGTGRLADLEEYAVAGKTGTSQKLVGGVYSHSAYISSFVCTGPVQSPRAVVLIVVDEPSVGAGRFGGTVAAPHAAEALKATLDYMLVDERRGGEMTYASTGEAPEEDGAQWRQGNAP